MKRLLVTGGSGFIGSNFIRHALRTRQDISIINLDKLTYAGNPANTKDFEGDRRYRFVHGDICDAGLVGSLMADAESVIHFAAESHVDRSIDSSSEFIRTNVLGTNVLLEAAKTNQAKRFIHFSTDEVYGSRKDGSFSEDDPLNPTNPYSASKAASDLVALSYWKTHRMPVIVIRSSNNFGPYQYPEKVIPLFITNLIEGKKVPLYAEGGNVRDWLFVGECVKAVEFIRERGAAGTIYNVGGGCELDNLTLTRKILAQFGKGDEWIESVPDRPAHDFRYSLDARALRSLGFSPASVFDEHLRATIDWYQNNRAWWEPLKKDAYTVK